MIMSLLLQPAVPAVIVGLVCWLTISWAMGLFVAIVLFITLVVVTRLVAFFARGEVDGDSRG